MRLSLIYLPELLHASELDSAPVLEDVLQVQELALIGRCLAITLFVLTFDDYYFWRMTPLKLYSICLGNNLCELPRLGIAPGFGTEYLQMLLLCRLH